MPAASLMKTGLFLNVPRLCRNVPNKKSPLESVCILIHYSILGAFYYGLYYTGTTSMRSLTFTLRYCWMAVSVPVEEIGQPWQAPRY